MNSVETELKSHQESLIGPQTDLEMASKVLPDTALIDQGRKEIQTLKAEIENQEAKLPSIG